MASGFLPFGQIIEFQRDVGDHSTDICWNWVKFDCGLAIAWGYATRKYSINQGTWGSLYYKTIDKFNLPSNLFVVSPYEWLYLGKGEGNAIIAQHTNPNLETSKTGNATLYAATSSVTNHNFQFIFLEIGFWKKIPN